MRELERDLPRAPTRLHLAIVGRGRLGRALTQALRQSPAAGLDVVGPLGREPLPAIDAVLLCVPDGEIARVARDLPPGLTAGHCSGATPLDALGQRERFVLHPLMTVTEGGARFAGAGAAVGGSSPAALAVGRRLARALGMVPVAVAEADRPAYHAAASIASNFLVTLEGMAERLAASAGVDRELLVPLVRATVENWAQMGAARALTGPVARGDEATVARQREAVAQRTPDLLDAFDALVGATRRLAATRSPAA